MKIRHLLSLIIAAISLSACGGGSSSPGATVPPPPPPPGATGLVIDPSNAKPAVKVAYGASIESMGTGDMVGGSGTAVSPGSELSKPFVQRGATSILTRIFQKDPFGPLITQCTNGGTETTSGNRASPITFTTGDTINVDYADCDNGLGEVLNGRMEMTIAVFSGDILLGLYLLDVNAILVDFEVATATDTVLSNGDSTVSIDTLGLPSVLLSVSGSALTMVATASTETITNFSTSQSIDSSVIPEPYTQTTSGTVNSTQLAGVISYTTPTAFQGAGIAYPFAGELVITGAGNATIRLIALDENNVRIETDSNGDGTVDATEDTTWVDIAS